MVKLRRWLVLWVAVAAAGTPAQARPARCTTPDDGAYACDFRVTDKDGSFEVTAPGKPKYILVMSRPGAGSAFVNLGNRNISMAGTFIRSEKDPACWVSDFNQVSLCVR